MSNQLVKAVFKGIPNVKEIYRGDGLYCHTRDKKSCVVAITEEKAIQLIADFPDEWDFPEIKNIKDFTKDFQEYRNRMIAAAENKKGIKVTYPDGTEEYYPSDSKVKIIKARKK